MNIKELALTGLELIDPNAAYSGSQTIFVDFDGAEDVSYDNDALNIHLDNLSVARTGLSEEQQSRIIAITFDPSTRGMCSMTSNANTRSGAIS